MNLQNVYLKKNITKNNLITEITIVRVFEAYFIIEL